MLFVAYLGPALGWSSFFYRDFGVLGYPTAAYHREMFWRGELPLWNPYSNCGVPFLAQWGTMTLYPFTLIYLLLPFPWSFNLFCLLHLWWGGVGIYRLARRWTGSDHGAVIASVLFLFNGITLSSLSWANYTVAFAWMPWILLSIATACHKGGSAIALAAVIGAMQMLAGVPELTLLTWALVCFDCLLSEGLLSQKLLRLSAVILLVAGLCAVQLLPFFELLSLSQRQTGAMASRWSIPIEGLGNFLLPMLHAFQTPQGTWFQHEQHFLSSTYFGLTAVSLAILGAIFGGSRARLLAVATLVSALLALGTNLPTFSLIQKLPVIGLARYPVKFALLLALTVPLCAAFGIRALEGKKFSALLNVKALVTVFAGLFLWSASAHPFQYDRWPETVANSLTRFLFFAVMIGLLFFWKKTERLLLFLLLIIALFLDGRFHLPNQNPTTSIATLRSGLHTHAFPKLGEGRVFISPEAEDLLLKSPIHKLDDDFIGKQLAVWSHLNLIELVSKVNGSATLNVAEQKELQDQLYSKTNRNEINVEAWLDFLAVTQITAPGKVVDWTNRTTALPLVHLAANFLEKSDLPLGTGTVAEWHFREQEVTAKVLAQSPATLVIAQTWHPAWIAEVNGEVKPVQKINHAFQAVVVPAGESSVRLHYRPPLVGAAISLLSLTACCWLLWPKRVV